MYNANEGGMVTVCAILMESVIERNVGFTLSTQTSGSASGKMNH